MSCACEQKRLRQEIDRMRRLAKVFAEIENTTAVLYKNEDGTYGFMSADTETDKEIIEYITPY